jgi:trigger factor
VVDLALERFLQSERLNLLGTPLPKVNEHFAWDAEELVFEYEIGLVPDFVLDLEAKNDIVKYVVTADAKLIDGQVERIQNNLVQRSSRRGCSRCRFNGNVYKRRKRN